jgi:phage gpG-like protein
VISATANFDAVLARLDDAADAAKNLDKPLARMAGWMRSQSKLAFDQQGPGWAPLAASTQARKLTAADVALFSKSKSGRSQAKTAQTEARKLAKAEESAKNLKRAAARDKAAARAAIHASNLGALAASHGFPTTDRLLLAIQRENARRKRHGEALRAARAATDPAEAKQLRQQAKRRYRISALSTQMLGGLRNSEYIFVDGNDAVVASRTKWSGIHNHGGTAGNGAHIPERRFLAIPAAAKAMFGQILQEHILGAYYGG